MEKWAQLIETQIDICKVMNFGEAKEQELAQLWDKLKAANDIFNPDPNRVVSMTLQSSK